MKDQEIAKYIQWIKQWKKVSDGGRKNPLC